MNAFTKPLYDRDSGLISARGIAILAGVDVRTVLAIPGATDEAVPAVDFPETLARRMNANLQKVAPVASLYEAIDKLAERAD